MPTTNDPLVLLDPFISVDGNVIAANGSKLNLDAMIEDLNATTFGQNAQVRRGGLFDATLGLTILNNYDAGEIDSIMWAILLGRVPVDVIVRPDSGAKGVNNPEYTGQILVTKWSPISGDVGKLVSIDVSWPSSGIWARATS